MALGVNAWQTILPILKPTCQGRLPRFQMYWFSDPASVLLLLFVGCSVFLLLSPRIPIHRDATERVKILQILQQRRDEITVEVDTLLAERKAVDAVIASLVANGAQGSGTAHITPEVGHTVEGTVEMDLPHLDKTKYGAWRTFVHATLERYDRFMSADQIWSIAIKAAPSLSEEEAKVSVRNALYGMRGNGSEELISYKPTGWTYPVWGFRKHFDGRSQRAHPGREPQLRLIP